MSNTNIGRILEKETYTGFSNVIEKTFNLIDNNKYNNQDYKNIY